MPKLKNSNATFWVIFKHCEVGFLGGLGAFSDAGLSHEASLVGLVYVHPLSLESYKYEYSYGFLLSSKKELIFAAVKYNMRFFQLFQFFIFFDEDL